MQNKNIVLVDIGNTSVSVALGNRYTVTNIRRLNTTQCNPKSVRKIIFQVLRNNRSGGGVLCSVVPQLNKLWIREMTSAIGKKPLLVSHRLNLGAQLNYPKPATIGADRLANICGTVHLYDLPVMIADFGTAATFDIITKKAVFIGGVIAPGLSLMTAYMADRTALLPQISIPGNCPRIGRNTEQAMQIGTLIGYHGLIREITEYLIRQNGLEQIKLVATGGLAKMALNGLNMPFSIDQTLTLQGLYRIFQLNTA
jgi:type III pantothenate kinase